MIVDEAAAPDMLASTNANMCIMCTKSTLADIYPALETCATSKANVITVAEELLFSGGSSPVQTRQLDALFTSNGVTVAGSGFIDGACCQMALALSANMHRITGMKGVLKYNADVNGPMLAVLQSWINRSYAMSIKRKAMFIIPKNGLLWHWGCTLLTPRRSGNRF